MANSADRIAQEARGLAAVQNVGLGVADVNGMVDGIVKSYSEKNGYGFISVPGQPLDIKFGAADITEPLAPGAAVRCIIALGPKGLPQAQHVFANSGGVAARPGKRTISNFGIAGSAPKQMRRSPAVGAQSTEERMSGLVKSFNVQHGFGFITVPGLADIFFGAHEVSPDVLPSIAIGLSVSFEQRRWETRVVQR
eukprot:NODE_16136_length_1010_cov_4.498301.p1 GENE.NODE_16136_length_1010_cov_4.498301~~NODE_16136_length_1010_cov_4.498301.p1  ORF type:complete len:195 (+),score=48.37 NODE_16136_length_1010_cov_4.498301:297-881(+)